MIGAFLTLALAAAPMLNSPVGQALTEPLRHGITGGRVGEWATFRIDGGGDRVHFWRIAVVGEEIDKKGRPACWLELDMGQHHAMKAPLLQLRMLVARAVGLNAEGVSRVILAVGAEKPNELTDDAVAQLLVDDHPAAPAQPGKLPVELTTFTGKPTQLMTLAGTVSATPVELRLRSSLVKRIWVSPQVPLLNLAKMEIPALAHTIEVRDYGINARPQMLLPQAGTAKIKLERYDDLVIQDPRPAP
ncbi:MAG: hypothetical protein H6Q89_5579 [Myxococcaceae bacterium]|nr:hypothetical protein [Myxococcaceae bacterium]